MSAAWARVSLGFGKQFLADIRPFEPFAELGFLRGLVLDALGGELLADQLQAGGHVVAMPQFGPILHAGAEYFPAAGTFRAVELGVEGPGVLRGQPAADDIGDGAVDGLLRCQRQGGHAAQQLLRMIRLMRGSLPRLR